MDTPATISNTASVATNTRAGESRAIPPISMGIARTGNPANRERISRGPPQGHPVASLGDLHMTMLTPYEPRPITFLGVEDACGYRLKTYAICYGDVPLDRGRFSRGWELATAVLPQPAISRERPGVGFAILHQGRTGDYLILSWWDRENELPTRIYVRGGDGWRPAVDGESFCVWDLSVIWREREAYVSSILSGRPDGVNAYLDTFVAGDA